MAVKAAVVGYEEITKPFEETVQGDESGAASETAVDEEIQDKELDELERKDLEGLLLHDVDGETDDVVQEEDVGLCELRLPAVFAIYIGRALTRQCTASRSTSLTPCTSNTRRSATHFWIGFCVSD